VESGLDDGGVRGGPHTVSSSVVVVHVQTHQQHG
jgi:hypothetical protein